MSSTAQSSVPSAEPEVELEPPGRSDGDELNCQDFGPLVSHIRCIVVTTCDTHTHIIYNVYIYIYYLSSMLPMGWSQLIPVAFS